jgi:hypothetical protein
LNHRLGERFVNRAGRENFDARLLLERDHFFLCSSGINHSQNGQRRPCCHESKSGCCHRSRSFILRAPARLRTPHPKVP